MGVRYGQKKSGQTKKEYVHMLNATLTATERTICCILENYQTNEGVLVPNVLRPFMGGMRLMPFVNELPKNVGKHKAAKAHAKKNPKQKAKPKGKTTAPKGKQGKQGKHIKRVFSKKLNTERIKEL